MNNFIRGSWIVSKYTFLEIIQSKILVNILFLGLGLVVVSFVASEFTFGVPQRVALDFGLGASSLAAVAIAIFLGVGLIASEIENRTAYIILSRPITRAAFLTGKVLGMVQILFLNIIILGTFTIIFFLYLGGTFSTLFLWTVFFTFLEAAIILAIVVLFSLITNNTMSVIYSVVIFVLGHAISEAQLTSYVNNREGLAWLIKTYAFFFPNFSKLNIKDFLLYKQELALDFLIGSSAYGLFYLLLILFVACLIFSRKDIN